MSAKPHAFVAMPFGTKTGADGQLIDFNRVYSEYIAPALEAAGLEAFRADQEQRAGDIRADMFQELLVADLVIADLTIDNPNVWYELGVRHALRARGVVLVSGSKTTAFDLYTDRKLRYGLKDGAPDPATLADDRRKLVEMVRATMESWHGRKVSPVYDLLPNLQEPDWKLLKVGNLLEFWQRHEAWEQRIELARRGKRIGDLKESELVVVFLSAGYEKADWCGLEWRAVRDLIKTRADHAVMPIRLDATPIPGLLSIDGYYQARGKDAQGKDYREVRTYGAGNETPSLGGASVKAR